MDFTFATFLSQDFEPMNLVGIESNNQLQNIGELNTLNASPATDPIISQFNNSYDEYQSLFQNDSSMCNTDSSVWQSIPSSLTQTISSQNSQIDASLHGKFSKNGYNILNSIESAVFIHEFVKYGYSYIFFHFKILLA
jgi:hypothetical protein